MPESGLPSMGRLGAAYLTSPHFVELKVRQQLGTAILLGLDRAVGW